MNMFSNYQKKGFTLVELLVAISIIGFLASIVLASLDGAKARARDAKRISDITQISRAFELHYSDKGYYPGDDALNIWEQTCVTGTQNVLTSYTNSIVVVDRYLPTWPCDPLNSPVDTIGTPYTVYSWYGYFIDSEPSEAVPGLCTSTCQAYCVFTNLERGGQFALGNSQACSYIRSVN